MTPELEARIQERARRLGYAVFKSRDRQYEHNCGRFMLMDNRYNVVLGATDRATLEEIAAYLDRHEPESGA